MIENLTEEHIGYSVIYRSPGGDKVERGRIKSWNDKFVFVVYNANDNWDGDHWKDYTAAPTRYEDLFWDGTWDGPL